MIAECSYNKNPERGIALITSLLATTILLGIGIAVVFSATVDTITTKNQRVGEQSFFAADAGIGLARRAVAQSLSEKLSAMQPYNAVTNPNPTSFYYMPSTTSTTVFPDLQVIPSPDVSPNDPFFQGVISRAQQLVSNTTRAAAMSSINGSQFSVNFRNFAGTVTLNKTDANNAVEVIVLRYAFQVNGTTAAGGTATVDEIGRLSANVTLSRQTTSSSRSFSFSGFGVLFDVGDPVQNEVLTPGTFTGPVHTNSHFAFYTNWQYNFRNVVSQVDPTFRVYPSTMVAVTNASSYASSIILSPQGYQQVAAVPLPANSFSQEYAVISGSGISDTMVNSSGQTVPVDPPATMPVDSHGNPLPVFDSTGRVTAQALAVNLRDASNNQPTVTTTGSGSSQVSTMANGVYVSSGDGSTLTGAGIYVQGNADDMQIKTDSSGRQIYVITQGGATTTITVTYSTGGTDPGSTQISSGGHTTTYSGVPTDKTDPLNIKAAAAVFVNGGITSLRGGVDNNAGSSVAAIASKTALTITAARSIKVTGDLKYNDPVVNADGTPVANIANVKNVLGLFTNDGNIYLDAQSRYSSNSDLSLEIDAADVVFNSNTSNDSAAPGTGQEGGITTWYGSGHTTPGGSARIKLVGSDVEKINSLVDYNNGDEFYDVRFSGGTFKPPFFPGTNYALGPPPTASTPIITAIDHPAATAQSWFRENN